MCLCVYLRLAEAVLTAFAPVIGQVAAAMAIEVPVGAVLQHGTITLSFHCVPLVMQSFFFFNTPGKGHACMTL